MPIQQLRKTSKKPVTGFNTHKISGSQQAKSASPIVRARRQSRQPASYPSRHTRREKKNWKRYFHFFLKLGVIALLIGGIFTVSVFAWFSRDLPDPNRIIDRDIAQSTKIYDRTGEKLLYEIHGAERRTLIELSDIPQYAIDATIAIEDKNFFKHGGLSLPNILKAVFLEALSKVGLYNKLVPGGSTLTQQFIKNAVLTTEKSYARKIKEFVLAYRLEKKFSKEEVLKLYFNEIPYGSTAYGIEAAAGIYFDKRASDLTLAESAILAALPQAPSRYSPYGSHTDTLFGRQHYILDLMVEQNFITEGEAEAAKQEGLVFKRRREDILAPHFVFMIKEELSGRYGERLIEQGGLKIVTTLDWDKQKIAEDTINEIAETNQANHNASNASLVSIDVATGEILAMVGSKDFFNDEIDGQVNVATALRQPGSSLKPLIYAKAFEEGYLPETLLFDLETTFSASGPEYRPKNYGLAYHGPVSLRQALQGSLNIPAVKLLYLVGVRDAVELAQKFGYTSLNDPDRYGLSLVLGGGEVTLLEHTNAYAVFAREGVYKPAVSVLKVQNPDGTLIEEHRDDAGKRAIDKNIIRQLVNVMSDNAARSYVFGASNYLTLAGRPAGAKTGTTNDNRDAWTLGFTPSIATGVWVGNNNNESMAGTASGSVVAAPIWNKFMNAILANAPARGFALPDESKKCDKPMLCGELGGEMTIKINKDTGKLAGPNTPPSLIQEEIFRNIHSILHYITVGDPFGPQPVDPAQDFQYKLWEEPIGKWAIENGYSTSTIPTEVDDRYTAEDQPKITWTNPSDNQIIKDNNFTFNVTASSRRGVVKVEYWLQDLLLGTSSQPPFSLDFQTSPIIRNGTYALRATAFDDIGNEKSATIRITLDTPRSDQEFDIKWLQPIASENYTLESVPSTIKLKVNNPNQLKKIDFYYLHGASSRFIGAQVIGNDKDIEKVWIPPTEPGVYKLYLIVTDIFNTVYTLPEIVINIE